MKNVEQLNQYWTNIYYNLRYTYEEKVSHQAIRIMQSIEKNEDMNLAALARELQTASHTASEHVKRLVEKEYIQKQRSTQDERKIVLQLTTEGRNVLQRHTQLDAQKLQTVFDTMTLQEQDTVLHAFQLLKDKAKQCTSS